MAAPAFYMTFRQPRAHRPLGMLKYNLVGVFAHYLSTLEARARDGTE